MSDTLTISGTPYDIAIVGPNAPDDLSTDVTILHIPSA